jgi:hypothetical protein
MAIKINNSYFKLNNGFFRSIDQQASQPVQLIGYVGTPTYYPGDPAITASVCTTPIYTSGLSFGQVAYQKIYYFDVALTNPLTESSLLYPFSTTNGGTTTFSFRMDASSGVGTNQTWVFQPIIGYYVVSTTKINVGNTDQFYSYEGDSGLYLGAFRYVTNTGTYPNSANTYAWSDTANTTAQYLATFRVGGFDLITLT